ncbi:MAG: PrsW family glutamic-type intramembrane protease [Polyangiales bacterium]
MPHRALYELLGIVIAVAPIAALYKVFRRVDALRPEPRGEVLRTLALGVVVCVPTYFAEVWLRRALGDAASFGWRALDAYAVAAGVEEAAKLLVVLAYPFRRRAFDEYTDGVLYAVAASLGFGLFENLLYVSNSASRVLCALPLVSGLCAGRTFDGTHAQDLVLGLVRAFTAVPMHALASGVMGLDLGRARFAGLHRQRGWPFIVRAWAAAVLVHGTYDWAVYALGHQAVVFVLIPLILGAAAWWLRGRVRLALAFDLELHGPGYRRSIASLLDRPSGP